MITLLVFLSHQNSLTYFIEGSENECIPTDTDIACIYYLGLYTKGSEAREIPFGLKVYVSNSGQRTINSK